MDIYFNSDFNNFVLAEKLKGYLKKYVKIKVEYKEYSDKIYIGCKYFSVYIDLEDDNNSDFMKEYFNMEVNSQFNVEIRQKEYEKALIVLAHLFSKIIINEKGNFLVLDECSRKIIWKIDKLYIASNYK